MADAKKTHNGKPIYYYYDIHKPTVQGEETDGNDSNMAEFWQIMAIAATVGCWYF